MSRIVANLSVSEMEPIGLEVNTQTDAQLNPAYGIRGEKGEKGDKGDKGDRGESGSQGEQGIPGVTPSFTIGTVSTLEPGSSATATITGTDEKPVLNLGIPKGTQGERGQDGNDGQDGQPGATGATPKLSIGTVETLAPGSSATATITGTDEEPILNLGIPAGANGANGTTPVRGTDYWTAADQQTVIDAAVAGVLAVYPAAEGVQF